MRRIDTKSTLFCLFVNVSLITFTGVYANSTSVFSYIYQAFLLFPANWLWGCLTIAFGGVIWVKSKATRKAYNDERSWNLSVRIAVFSVFLPPLILGGILWWFFNETGRNLIFASLIVAIIQVLLAAMGWLRPFCLQNAYTEEDPIFASPLFKREEGEVISSWEFLMPRPIIKAVKNMKDPLSKSRIGRFVLSIFETCSRLIGSPL